MTGERSAPARARLLWVVPTALVALVAARSDIEADATSWTIAAFVAVFVAVESADAVRSDSIATDANEVVVVPAALVIDPVLAGLAHAAGKLGLLPHARPYRLAFTMAATWLSSTVGGALGRTVLDPSPDGLDTSSAATLVLAVAITYATIIAGTTLATAAAVWVETGSSERARAETTSGLPWPVVVAGLAGSAVGVELMRSSLPAATLYVLAVGGIVVLSRYQLRQERDLVAERTARAEALDAVVTVADRERQDLIHRIHDGSMQDLVVARMVHDLARSDPTATEAMDQAGEAIERAIQSLRSVLSGSDSALALTGLEPALEALRDSTRAPAGTDIVLDLKLPPALGTAGSPEAEAAVCVLAGLREALNNAVRHAGASRIELAAWIEDGQLRAQVVDDGVGFDPAAVLPARRREGHLGVVLTEERLTRLGGDLLIESAPGSGTVVALSVPLPAPGP